MSPIWRRTEPGGTAVPAAILLLALVALPGRAAGQTWSRDTTTRRLDWGAVNVLISADTARGVSVWAETSSLIYRGQRRAFIAPFDPAAVKDWLDKAYALVTLKTVPSAKAVALETPPLMARDSSGILVLRRRDAYGWDNHVRVVFFPPDSGAGWAIRVPLDRAEQFLQTFFSRAIRSRLAPEASMPQTDNPLRSEHPGTVKGDTPPQLLFRPQLHYPPLLRQQGLGGEVWLQFVLRENGKVDPASFVARLYDDSAFVDEAVRCLARSRWRPATLGGRPISTVISQRVVFRPE